MMENHVHGQVSGGLQDMGGAIHGGKTRCGIGRVPHRFGKSEGRITFGDRIEGFRTTV